MKSSNSFKFGRANLLGITSASLGALLTQGGVVQAQSVEPEGLKTQEEVIVTARKRDETLHEVPLSMTAFSSENIENIGAKNLEDISVRTPGLQYASQGGQSAGRLDTALRFRGMDINSEIPTQQLATVFIDGIPVVGGIAGVGVEDLERIEVIKGPQSAFFGRSTFGGAINYVTRTPGDEFQGRISAQIAAEGEYDATGSWEGPIVPGKLSFRITGRSYHRDGKYRSAADNNLMGEENTDALQLTLYTTPTDNFDAKARVMVYEDDDGAPAGGFIGDEFRNCYAKNGGPLFVRPPDFSGPGPVDYFCGEVPRVSMSRIGSNTVLPPRGRELFYDRNSPLLPPLFTDQIGLDHVGLRRKALRTSLAMNYRLEGPDITISSLSGYNEEDLMHINDFDKEIFEAWYGASARKFQDFNQELRVSSATDGRLGWLFGAHYFQQKFQNNSWAWMPLIDFLANTADIDNKVTTTSVFAALSYDISDQWNVSLEGRYQEDELDDGLTAAGVPMKKTFSNFLPRVILQFQPTDATNLYATYSMGNKPGDFNDRVMELNDDEKRQVIEQTGGTEFVPEEELENFELGWKQRLFDNRASFAIAAYYMKWKNQQTKVPAIIYNPNHPNANPVTGTRPIEILIAAGKTDLWGVELEGSARVAEGLDLGLTFGWAASEYKVFECGFVARFVGHTDCAGNSSPRFPEFSGSINANYSRDLTPNWSGFIRGDVLYFGKAYIDESNLAWTKDYTTVNLRIGGETDKLRIELWARNLLDDYYYVAGARGTDFTNGFNFDEQGAIVTPTMGRQIGITATMKF